MTYTYRYESPLGGIILACDEAGLTGLWFEGQKYFGSTLPKGYAEKGLFPAAVCEKSRSDIPDAQVDNPAAEIFEETVRWLDLYFQGQIPDFLPRLSWNATPFQKGVWEILLTIPYGQTMTYGAIAARMAERMGLASMSAQAVGGAVGHNPISIIVPCHRVVGANGKLTGYAGGIHRKEWLLALEKENASKYIN